MPVSVNIILCYEMHDLLPACDFQISLHDDKLHVLIGPALSHCMELIIAWAAWHTPMLLWYVIVTKKCMDDNNTYTVALCSS